MTLPGVPRPNADENDWKREVYKRLDELERRQPNLQVSGGANSIEARLAALEAPFSGRWVRSTVGTVAAGSSLLLFPDAPAGTPTGVTYDTGVFTLGPAGKWEIELDLRFQGGPFTGRMSTWVGSPTVATTRYRIASGPVDYVEPMLSLKKTFTTPSASFQVGVWVFQDTGATRDMYLTYESCSVSFTYKGAA